MPNISDEIAFLDATAQASLVRKGEVSAQELVNASIERIELLNPQLNAVIAPLFDQAITAAEKVDKDAVFAGVPFVLKDLVSECSGSPRTDGSGFIKGRYISEQDNELVSRYKKAGLIILGKTNSSEFGLLPTTEPACHGATRNPWDTSRGTGGSSGGSAAAVATAMVAAGHANDGGGSIRIPASCCGLVGLKPTRGRNSLAPNYGDIAGGIICEHAVTRSVRDSAILLDATSGPVPGEPYMLDTPQLSFAEAAKREPGKLRIGFDTVALNGVSADPDCITATHKVAKQLEQAGHIVEQASPTVDGMKLFAAFGKVMAGYLGWCIEGWSQRLDRMPEEKDFEPVTWRMYEHSKQQTSAEYLLAQQAIQSVCRDFSKFFTQYDLWLSPTLLKPPVPLDYFSYTYETRHQHNARLGDFTAFTLIANASGHPAISLPLHWNDDNLPIGVHFTGRYGDEATLLGIATQLEQMLPWSHRRPPVCQDK